MKTNETIKIAAVVVTFNRKHELKKTIEAFATQGLNEADIIVINNNSKDETRAMLQKDFQHVNSIHLSENIASAGGFSLGMKVAFEKGFDWVWLFNDDSRPTAGALQSVLKYLYPSNNQNIGLLKIGNINQAGKAILLYWNGARRSVYIEPSNNLTRTDLITFDGCLISRKLMERIGYCDPKYFMGIYEFDYCLKAAEAGFGIYTIPNGLIEDGKLGSAKGTPPWRQYYNTRNHLWLALHKRSLKILMHWIIREIKYTYGIMRFSDRKIERFVFKFRATRDALLNRRGKTYDPEKLIK